eukprot:scaffold130090_cov34-Prasinocladus_malaysianus.AAC.1
MKILHKICLLFNGSQQQVLRSVVRQQCIRQSRHGHLSNLDLPSLEPSLNACHINELQTIVLSTLRNFVCDPPLHFGKLAILLMVKAASNGRRIYVEFHLRFHFSHFKALQRPRTALARTCQNDFAETPRHVKEDSMATMERDITGRRISWTFSGTCIQLTRILKVATRYLLLYKLRL